MPVFVGFQAIVVATIVVAFVLELIIPPVPIGNVPVAWGVYRGAWFVLSPLRAVWARLTGATPPSRPHPRVRVPLSFAAAFFFSWLAVFVVFMPWLTLLQLAVVWTTYAILNAIRSLLRSASGWKQAHDRAAAQLEAFAKDADEKLRRSIEAALNSAAETIRGSAHRRALENAVDDAQNTLCIVSGWINDRAVDDRLLARIEAAAQRGVTIYVGFGYESRHPQNMSMEHDPSTWKAVIPLAKIGQIHAVGDRPSVALGWIRTHEKLVVVDDAYSIVGSHNWLSNSAFANAETSVRYRSRELARGLGEDIARRVREQPFSFKRA